MFVFREKKKTLSRLTELKNQVIERAAEKNDEKRSVFKEKNREKEEKSIAIKQTNIEHESWYP